MAVPEPVQVYRQWKALTELAGMDHNPFLTEEELVREQRGKEPSGRRPDR